jgi:hypothetical protein
MPEEDYASPDMPMGGSNDKASIIEKINPDEIVELIRMRLMGRMRNERTGIWETVEALKNNAISELGAWEITNLILSISNANTSLSKLKDMEIRKRSYSVMVKAIKMMVANFREYHITNTAQLGYISEIVFSITFITLKMADNEGIRKMITSMYSENRSIMQQSEVKGRNLFRK